MTHPHVGTVADSGVWRLRRNTEISVFVKSDSGFIFYQASSAPGHQTTLEYVRPSHESGGACPSGKSPNSCPALLRKIFRFRFR
jgi:hypothetical protein